MHVKYLAEISKVRTVKRTLVQLDLIYKSEDQFPFITFSSKMDPLIFVICC